MKTLRASCIVFAGLCLVLTGCIDSDKSGPSDKAEETNETELTSGSSSENNERETHSDDTGQSYPNINLPLSDFSANIINDTTGVGEQTLWSCVEPANDFESNRTRLVFTSDGTGTYASSSTYSELSTEDLIDPMTWRLVDNDLYMNTSDGTVIYSDVSMPISSVITAKILQARAVQPKRLTPRSLAPGDGTGDFSCRAVYVSTDLDPLPLSLDVFANGATAQSATSSWNCPASPTSTPYPEYTFDMILGADGSGIFSSYTRINEPVSVWLVDYRTINITAADGTSIVLEVVRHYGDTMYVSSTVDGVFEGIRDCELTGTTDELLINNDEVTLGATVLIGARSTLTIDYRITNKGSDELISFDASDGATAEVESDGSVTIYKAKRDTGATDFDEQPTIAGRNLSPGQMLQGTVVLDTPIPVYYPEPSESVNPNTFNFCVGYGKADDLIPQTLVDGTYTFNTDLDLQSLTCTQISKPSGPID